MVDNFRQHLREGEQTPLCQFYAEREAENCLLAGSGRRGDDRAGDPSVSPGIATAVAKISRAGTKAEIVAHSWQPKGDR